MKYLSRSEMIFSILSLAITLTSSGHAYAGTSLQKVACPERGIQQIDLFNDKGAFVGLHVTAYEPISVFQGWGKNEITVGAGSKRENMIRVQIPGQKPLANQSFFIDKKSATALAQCETRRNDKSPANILPLNFGKRAVDPLAPIKPVAAVNAKTSPANVGEATDEGDDSSDEGDAPEHPAVIASNGAGGLKSATCCGFPLASRPHSFLGGIAKFGARRLDRHKDRRGHVQRVPRTHGGADLYGARGQTVFAITDGTVIRAPYIFKPPTFAIDVRHAGGFVVRYGEITGKNFGMQNGARIRKGQPIAAMNYVPGAPAPMIHFELFRGNLAGKLSPGGNKYHRRGDLMDPTSYLRRWGKI